MNQSKQYQSRRVLPIISVVTFLGFLDTTLLIPILALYAAELNATVGTIGLIVGLYSITNTPANILFGWLIDRVGYKLPLVAGLIGDALSMFFYSLCGSPIHLALVRVFHGISGAVVGPATMSFIAGYSERAGKGRAMGFYGMAIAAANLVGFGLSGIVVSRWGYKVLFWFGSAILAFGAGISQLLPGSAKKVALKTDAQYAGGFTRIKNLLRRRGLVVAYCSIFAQYFTFGGVVILLPFHVESLGMETFHVGMLMATFAIMFIIVQFPGGAFSDKVGWRIPTAIGLGLGIVSLVMLPSQVTFPLLAVVMGLYGISYGLLFPSISALIADHTLPEERGLATGMFHALLTAGVAIGAPIMGWVGGAVGIELGLVLSSGVMALTLIVVLTALRRV